LGRFAPISVLAWVAAMPVAAFAGAPPPCGIYVLDSTAGAYRDANIRNYSFVDGYDLRLSWSALETSEGVYDFSTIDHVVGELQAIGQKLNLEVYPPNEPAYVPQATGAVTWLDTATGVNAPQTVPWDSFTLARFQAFAKALAAHTLPDSSKGGAQTAFADHPVLAHLTLGIPGAPGAIRDPLPTHLADMPGYTRAGFEAAVLADLRAATDNFPHKAAFIGFWVVTDSQASPALWSDLRSKILAEFDGIQNPKVGFFQENLAASKDLTTGVVTGYPSTTFAAPLYLSRGQTPILFQALEGWDEPFADATKVANTTPADAIQFAYEMYDAAYFELYVNDIDDTRYRQSFTEWAGRLCMDLDQRPLHRRAGGLQEAGGER